MVRYDQDDHLGSLLPNPDQTRPTAEAETWPDTYAELGETVRAGNGVSTASTSSTSTEDPNPAGV